MTGSQILKNLFKLIHQHYVLNIPDFDLQVDEGFWTNDETIDQLKNHGVITAKSNILFLLEAIKETKTGQAFISEEFTPYNNVELLNFTQGAFRKRNRAFSYSDLQFGYVSLKKLFQINPLSNIDPASEDYRTLIDYIGTSITKAETQNIIDLLIHIEHSHDEWGIMVHKFEHTHNSLSIYSYLYYQELLKGGKIQHDQRLEYDLGHGATTAFLGTTKYEQYFEVFDIINELNCSEDIITRYLKVYHILEYLVYRVELVEIERKARINRTFIREIHGLTGKGQSEKEYDIFKKNFNKIFSDEIVNGIFNVTPLNDVEKSFLKNNWDLENINMEDSSHIAKLIYRIRNSIVHNKESEFHITTTNPDDYADVIGLMKRFLPIIEKLIFDKISSNTDIISYASPNIELY